MIRWPTEFQPRSLCDWGGDSDGGGGGGGGYTGGGDWGSSGSYDASGFDAGGIGAWGGSAYDASVFGSGMGGGGDWGSFGDTSYGGFNAPNPTFADIGGPNPGVTTGGGDWGSAGTFSAAGTGGGPGGAMFGADLGAGAGAPGQLGGGLFSDYGGGGGNYIGGGGGWSTGDYSGGGGGYTGGGGGGRGGGGGGAFGGFTGTSSMGTSHSAGGHAAAQAAGSGKGASLSSPYADDTGPAGRGESEVSSPYADDTGPTGRGEQEGPEAAPEAAPEAEPSDFGKPAAPEADVDPGPSLTDAAPAGMIGGSRDAAPAAQPTADPTNWGAVFEGAAGPSQTYQDASQQLSDLTQSSLSGYDYSGSPYANMGPADQAPAAPDFNQAFQAFEAQPGWNPAEQTAGWTGLAEPTDWAANPYAASTDVSVGRDFNQVFDAFDTPTGMDLAGDQRSEAEPALTFNEMWGTTPYSTLPNDQLSRSAQQTLEHDFGYFPNPGYVQGPPAPATSWYDQVGAVANPALNAIMQYPLQGIDALLGADPATAWSNFAQNALLGGSNIQSLNPDAIAAYEAGQQGRAGANPDTTPWGSVFEGAAAPAVGPAIEASIPGGRTTDFDYNVAPTQAPIDVEVVRSDDPALAGVPGIPQGDPAAPPEGDPATPPAAPPATLPPAVETPQEARPTEPTPPPPQTPPQEAQPISPPGLVEMVPGVPPPQAQPTGPPGLVTMLPPAAPAPPPPPGVPAPQQPAPAVPEPGEPDDDVDPHMDTPARPGGRLGEPTTGTQNTPAISPRVRQEQQGSTRNRPVNERLHGILTQAAEHAGVTVRVGSGGQIATRNRADYRQHGGWTGSTRHNHGNAADIRLEQNGRLLNYNNPNDRTVMEAFVREAARLGATGMGAGDRYMGPNTIHVGFGAPAFWRTDSPGSRALRQAWNEGRHGPANRPPADIPVRTARPPAQPAQPARPAAPPGGWRGIGGDIGREARLPQPQPDVPRPPADIPPPAALPPQDAPPAPRPPADIPINIPAPFLTPPARGRADPKWQTDRAQSILKQATAHLGKQSGEADFQAASKVAAKELAAAGIPLATARSLMTKGAYEGAESVGYGPSSIGWNAIYKGRIDGGIEAALQGYNPGATGPTPQGGRYGPGPVQGPQGFQPDVPAQQRSEAPSLLNFLQNFNPISTAEAAGRGSRGSNAIRSEPAHDPAAVSGRLADARSNIVSELRANQGLHNLLDLVATMEVGSQGKAAVQAFIEMQLNRAAAEARTEGRQATAKDLSRLLNDRVNYQETWGKIDAGKGKTGALTDDVLAEVGAGSNLSKGSTGNASGRVGFGGNPANTKIGNERFGTENFASHNAWYSSLYGPAGIGIGSDFAADDQGTAVGAGPPAAASPASMRGLAKGGRVDKDEPVVVGEEGPEYFVPDRPGTVVPHMPQPGQGERNIDRWPKVPAVGYPGQYGGVEREIRRQIRGAQDPVPSLMDMIDSGQLRLNAANWNRMISDPSLIALGRSRIEDRR